MSQSLLKKYILSLLIVLTGAALAGILWIVTTTNGSRWLIATIAPLGGVEYSVQSVEGSFNDHLYLTGVRVTLGQQKWEIDSLGLRWQPLLLLTGTIAVEELFLKGVRVQDDTPSDNKPPNLVWPRMPESAHLFDGKIAQLRVKDISYRQFQNQPLIASSITGSLSWQDSLLSIDDLLLLSPSGQVRGSLSTGFKQPSLTADLAIALTRPVADMDRFSLQAKRTGRSGSEQLIEMISIAGSTGTRKLLELKGDVGLARDALNLHRLHLTRPGQKGLITADGSLTFTGLQSLLSLQVQTTGLDLGPELNLPTNLSGSLRFAGTLDSYRGDFTLANQAQGWQSATVSAVYQGTRAGMKLAPLTGKLLDGTLAGDLAMGWRNGFQMQGAITGKNLNPARISPDWQGLANFTATGKLAWSEQAKLTGSIKAALLESRLHGQTLTGELQADYADHNLLLAKLVLLGKGFDLHASGQLNQRISLAANISDLSRLVPGAGGTIKSNGWLRWNNGDLTGAVTGTGNRLAYGGAQAALANLTARLDPGSDHPMQVTANLKNVVYDQHSLPSVTLALAGTLPHHTLNATFRSGDAQAQLALSAGYQNNVWKGELSRLAGSDKSGPWKLAAPATFSVSAARLALSPFVLIAGATERLELAAIDLALKPLSGQVRAQWSGVDLERFKPWFPSDTSFQGRVSGQAKGNLLAGQRFELDGTAVLSGGKLHRKKVGEELNLAFRSATASWVWRGEALTGDLALTMAEYGQLKGNFQLPIAARFPITVNRNAPLRASLTGQVREKGIISALFPGLVQESFGEMDADLALSGTWNKPSLGGKLRLAKAGAFLPTAGVHLKDIQLTARLDKNLIRIDSFKAASGPGHIEGAAVITLADWRVVGYQGTLRGENFQTIQLPELQVLSSPDLTFEGNLKKLTLRGDLRLPELHIVGSQPTTGITPSSDVIMDGRVVPVAKSSPLALDVQLRVTLGDKVFIKLAGINAQLGGAINLSFADLERIVSRGEIKVVKGRYRTYGVNLEIIRGRLFFSGGPINNPSLDILALRTIGSVRAGVTVTGTLLSPVTKLYSEPAMPDVDVLAYIVLGHPLSSSGQQASLVARAAGALLTSRQAGVLQEQIKNKLGLSTLEIQGGIGASNSHMDYKPLQVTAPGSIPATQQAGITETVLTAGKYLTPQLYISYGRSLFTGNNLFRLRYDIFKKWQIETQTGGGESGADLYYKLEFD